MKRKIIIYTLVLILIVSIIVFLSLKGRNQNREETIWAFRKRSADLPFLLFCCCLTALVTAVIPFLSYTLGLRTVEASRAGILATIEPMVATLIGILVFAEPLTLLSGLGILLILAAVVLLNRKQNQ